MSKNRTSWFETDKKGLEKIAKERGSARIVVELVSNAVDEAGVTKIDVTAEPVKNKSYVNVLVEDNSPQGFHDLSHAFTLFAESYKRDNPEQRGQFNFGEKLFLSLCQSAHVVSTTGTISFDEDAGRTRSRKRREHGTAV